MQNRDKKQRRLRGTVVSDKMLKTVIVEVVRSKVHPRYRKQYQLRTRFKAHDENKAYKVGDQVIIQETRPLSKEKRWRVISRA
jgi:small subunit ribosomal protein S17